VSLFIYIHFVLECFIGFFYCFYFYFWKRFSFYLIFLFFEVILLFSSIVCCCYQMSYFHAEVDLCTFENEPTHILSELDNRCKIKLDIIMNVLVDLTDVNFFLTLKFCNIINLLALYIILLGFSYILIGRDKVLRTDGTATINIVYTAGIMLYILDICMCCIVSRCGVCLRFHYSDFEGINFIRIRVLNVAVLDVFCDSSCHPWVLGRGKVYLIVINVLYSVLNEYGDYELPSLCVLFFYFKSRPCGGSGHMYNGVLFGY
jgi:hypothetical protein